MLTKFYLILFFSIALVSCKNKKQTYHLIGKIKDSSVESIILVEVNQDFRFDSIINIPVNKGKIDYEFKYDNPRAFNLMLGDAKKKGGGKFMPLFLEKSDVHLVIYPDENFENNIIEGGKLNNEYKSFKNNFDSIIKKKPQMKFEDQLDIWKSYIEKKPTLVSYYLFLNILNFRKNTYIGMNEKQIKDLYQNLKEANKNHPYNELAKSLITATENIKIGNRFVDFNATDINGNMIRLSDQIEGKIALIDLWATWCGPCIKKTREVLPIYKKYKDKGFTIVGVAGEFKNTNRLEKFLKNEKWPWINLVELNRNQNIWQKYGVDGGGGGMFLVDKNGKFIAINPDINQIQKEIEKRLN